MKTIFEWVLEAISDLSAKQLSTLDRDVVKAPKKAQLGVRLFSQTTENLTDKQTKDTLILIGNTYETLPPWHVLLNHFTQPAHNR